MINSSPLAEELYSTVNGFLTSRQYDNVTDIIKIFNSILDNFRLLIKEEKISLLLLNNFYNIIYTDENIKSITGSDNNDLRGKAISEIIHPSDSELLKNHFVMLSAKALDCTCLNIRIKQNNKHWVSAHCYAECFVDKYLNFYYGIFLMNYEQCKEYLELFDKISLQIYKNKMLGILSFLKIIKKIMLRNSADEINPAVKLKARLGDSIYSLFGCPEFLIKEIDNLSQQEIKMVAEELNNHLKYIYSA